MLEPLKIKNRWAYLRKSITSPNFKTDRVLTKNIFRFVELWISTQKQIPNKKQALCFWKQAEYYYNAARNLPSIAAPLTLHYCYLNAIKTAIACQPDGREKLDIREFVHLAPRQFIDELACQLTSLELAAPGVRPTLN